MADTTSVQISRDASHLLDRIAKESGLTKTYLATVAIRKFYDPQSNPHLESALANLSSGRNLAESQFISTIMGPMPEEKTHG